MKLAEISPTWRHPRASHLAHCWIRASGGSLCSAWGALEVADLPAEKESDLRCMICTDRLRERLQRLEAHEHEAQHEAAGDD